MGFFQETYNQTIIMVIMITSFFSTMFFFILYAIGRERGILMLFFSNLFQIALTASLWVLARTNNEWALVAANTISVMITVFWINAFFVIFNVKCSYLTLVAINSFGTLMAVALYSLFRDIQLLIVSTTILVMLITFLGAIKFAIEIGQTKNRQEKYSVIVMSAFGAINLIIAALISINPLDFSDFSNMKVSAAIFILICYGFSLIVNYSVLYINYEELLKKAQKLSCIDKLTGTLSRSAFFVMLNKKLAEVRRGMGNICVALLDIDNFKQINDTYGHLAGDEVLRCFTRTIKDNIRANDIIGRYGGEEFMLILQAQTCGEAKHALGRIRKKIAAQPLIHDEHVTFSCGHMFVEEANCDTPVDSIIRAIDLKMYEAKAQGKDRIV